MREGSTTLVAVAALIVAVLALVAVALRPPVIVNVPEGGGSGGGADVLVHEPTLGCRNVGTEAQFSPRFWYENRGNRTAFDTVANLTYIHDSITVYLDVALGDIPAHTGAFLELATVVWYRGVDACADGVGVPTGYEFRVTMTWDP